MKTKIERHKGLNMYLRKHENYDEYVLHQIKKTANPKLRESLQGRWDGRKIHFLREFAKIHGMVPKGAKAVCLGARLGEEVEALNELDYDAIGIDLVPCEPLVIKGDFHDMPFDDLSFDLVYSNSVDHIYKLDKFVSEIKRVLRTPGFVYFRLASPEDYGNYESIRFEYIDQIIQFFPRFQVLLNESNKREGRFERVNLLMKRS